MKSSNILMSILTVTSIGAGITAHNFNNTNKIHKKYIHTLSKLNLQLVDKQNKLKDDLTKHQQELKNSKNLLSFLNAKLLALQKISLASNKKLISTKEKNSLKNMVQANVEEITDTDAYLQLLNTIKSADDIQNIENKVRDKFNKEEIDNNWAYESHIWDLAAADKDNNFDIQELNCKTTACEIKITANKNNAMFIGTLFSKVLSEQDWRDTDASVIFNREIKDGVMDILIGRNNNSFN